MRRSFIILLGALAVGAAVFAGSFLIARQCCVRQLAAPADDLDWLRREFKLNDAELARVRQLHEGYLPKCGEMCARIAAKKGELESALAGTTNVSSTVEKNLIELGELRAQCQAQMLRHFLEVSQAMPPEQGRRYLAEMQRLTLGSHEEIEQSMSDHAGHEHHHE
jgi:hypothetical protein